jgi:hypothetical protein
LALKFDKSFEESIADFEMRYHRFRGAMAREETSPPQQMQEGTKAAGIEPPPFVFIHPSPNVS